MSRMVKCSTENCDGKIEISSNLPYDSDSASVMIYVKDEENPAPIFCNSCLQARLEMSDRGQLETLLAEHPEFEQLANEAEALRCEVDDLVEKKDYVAAFSKLIAVDNLMLVLVDYHVRLSTQLLKLDRE